MGRQLTANLKRKRKNAYRKRRSLREKEAIVEAKKKKKKAARGGRLILEILMRHGHRS